MSWTLVGQIVVPVAAAGSPRVAEGTDRAGTSRVAFR